MVLVAAYGVGASPAAYDKSLRSATTPSAASRHMCDPLAPTAVAGLPSAMKLSPSLPSRVAVGCQWITHRAVSFVPWTLGQSLLQGGGDSKSGGLMKSGENVIGSH